MCRCVCVCACVLIKIVSVICLRATQMCQTDFIKRIRTHKRHAVMNEHFNIATATFYLTVIIEMFDQ